MPKIRYQAVDFKAATRAVIRQANDIIDEYVRQGFDLTLRQLYYQFVSRDLLANNQKSYKRLGSIVNDARMAGLIDWDRITDRTRNLRELAHWRSPQAIVAACAGQFRTDKWAAQPYRLECWIEKDALVGVIAGVCDELQVPYFSCRGYTSQSEMWAAGRRFRTYLRAGKRVKVLHLGDHDPSGIDMSRDIAARLKTFAEGAVRVDRLALNMDQVRRYNPPPNPAKDTDSRAEWYNREYGAESWELDALEPAALAALIRDAVAAVRDEALWAEAVRREALAREQLAAVAGDWDAVTARLGLDPFEEEDATPPPDEAEDEDEESAEETDND